MKYLFTRFMIGAAAAMVMSAGAWAETVTTANVPFSFQVGGKTLPPGQYRIDNQLTNGVVTLRNEETNQAVMAIGVPAGNPNVYDNPGLDFRCSGDSCSLREIRFPYATYMYSVPNSGNGYHASVAINSQKAD